MIWQQHPIGHGGFHTGQAISPSNEVFCWIFDCGSRKTAKFDRYLQGWIEDNPHPINWLFISHFDTDHVSGLDRIMQRLEVRQVMVPYLENEELLISMLAEVDRGSLNRVMVELVADPASYFLSRGASQVVFLGGPGEPEEGEGITRLGGDPDHKPKGWQTKMMPELKWLPAPAWADRSHALPLVGNVPSTSCEIISKCQEFGLKLKPYCRKTGPAARKGFVKRIEELVDANAGSKPRAGLGRLAFAVAAYARTVKGRADLRAIYTEFFQSSNRSSMSLLSIPTIEDEQSPQWIFSHHSRWMGEAGVPAWVNTGDAELLGRVALSRWKENYDEDLPSVKALALPHHGSDLNSGAGFADLNVDAALLAHVKMGASKHPGPRVTLAASDRLCLVTGKEGSKAQMQFFVRPGK
ncbi:MBL fold metallo-hydrolase [Paracoccus sp. (in: a-proteobacteria)]|uniref:MBL fold metallo-hydrolase n=1 Tax=Paracoccus sp. TaxID=267 RepID=UPI0028A2D020|nr:MBL fold metallo-hydrolase [Paracoccus sp. (in: a-proteobacteria)]